MPSKNIGLIGIGLLGSALAERLMQAGYNVWGFDNSARAVGAFAEIGGQPVARIADVPVAASTIFLSLPTSEIVEEVMVQIIPHLKHESVLIDTTTGEPARTQELGQRLNKANIELLDASVLGSSQQTRIGDAVLMVGASMTGFNAAESVLHAISNRVYHLGEIGSGQQMKLVANLVLGLNRAVLAEGLHFAQALHLDPDVVLDVLKSGAAYSRVMETKGRKMIDRDFEPQARLSQHLKDVNLILDHAESAETQLPLSELHRLLLKKVEDAGSGGLDNSAICQAW